MLFVRARVAYKIESPVPSSPVRPQAQTNSAKSHSLRTTLTSDCLLQFPNICTPFRLLDSAVFDHNEPCRTTTSHSKVHGKSNPTLRSQ